MALGARRLCNCNRSNQPFDTYYFSFAKGFYDTDEISKLILQEAWEHWHHKVSDYLRNKSFPDRVMLIDFQTC